MCLCTLIARSHTAERNPRSAARWRRSEAAVAAGWQASRKAGSQAGPPRPEAEAAEDAEAAEAAEAAPGRCLPATASTARGKRRRSWYGSREKSRASPWLSWTWKRTWRKGLSLC